MCCSIIVFLTRCFQLAWIIDRNEWFSIYSFIKSRVSGLNFHMDQYATDILSDLLRNRSGVVKFHDLIHLFKGFSEAYVIGCSENVYDEVEKQVRLLENGFIIAADGATSVLLDYGIVPNIVTSDLDGDIRDLLYASSEGSIVVIHAHGDNIDKLREYTHLFQNYVMGSTQVEPRPYVYNFGGFTDGDRAVHLAYYIGVHRVKLIGFDFNKPFVCPGDKRVLNKSISSVKLEIALMLLKLLVEKGLVIECVEQGSCKQILHS